MKKGNLHKFILALFCLITIAPFAASANGGQNHFSAAFKANVPNWAVGTFTARNPQNGGTITLTILSNGNVTVNMDGNLSYGTFNNKTLTLNGITSKVKRTGNGIRTTRNDNGERIDYVRGFDGGGGNSGGNGNVPSWAIGKFYARSPQDGTPISLTIDGNGATSVDINGSMSYGTLSNDRLTINGITSRVQKINDGIRTTRIDSGERIDYTRDGGGGNGGGNGSVPNWAVGTFYGRSPQDGTPIALTIDRSGSVTVNINGSITNGTISNDRLTLNGITSRVERSRNGIRTIRLDNGERIDYTNQQQ